VRSGMKTIPSDTVVRLHAKWKGGRFGHVYDVELADGALILTDSHDPEHDACRALLAHGITGVLHLIDGKTGKPRSHINIEAGAKWRVSEEDRGGLRLRRWSSNTDISPPAGEKERPGQNTPDSVPSRLSMHLPGAKAHLNEARSSTRQRRSGRADQLSRSSGVVMS